MRVGIAGVLPSDERLGGVETVVSEVAKELASKGCVGIEVISMRRGNSIPGLTTHVFDSHWSILSVFHAWQFLRSNEYDVVHAHIPAAGIASILAEKKTVYTFHSIPLLEEEKNLIAKIGHIIEHLLLKMIVKKARVTVVCDYLKEAVREFYGVDSVVIYNGLNQKNYSFPKLKRDGRNILFVGRIVPRKGIDYLVKAMDKIVKQVPDVKLHIVGGGILS